MTVSEQRQLIADSGAKYHIGNVLLRSGGQARTTLASSDAHGLCVIKQPTRTEFGTERSLIQRMLDNEDRKTIANFRQEIRVARDIIPPLQDHRLVTYLDSSNRREQRFIAFDYVEGCDLSDVLKNGRRLHPDGTIELFTGLTRAIGNLHTAGYVHHDLKPANVRLRNGDLFSPVVLDFGLAGKDTGISSQDSLEISGTPQYMSPEHIRSQRRSEGDVYSLGIMLYEALTGELPLAGANPLSMLRRTMSEEVQDPRHVLEDIPEALANVVINCTRKNLANRYQNANDIAEDLARISLNARTQKYFHTSPTKVYDSAHFRQSTIDLKSSDVPNTERHESEASGALTKLSASYN